MILSRTECVPDICRLCKKDYSNCRFFVSSENWDEVCDGYELDMEALAPTTM